jgi:glycosyltransferase involved in cell wall biosynthesis
MKVLIVTETLYPRGAETFLVRLANAIAKQHEVILLNLHPYWSKIELINQLDSSIQLISRKCPQRKLFQKVDGGLIKLGVDYSFTDNHIVDCIHKVITDHQVDVVHSHLFKPDYYVAMAKQRFGLKFNHVITNHGDYLLYDKTSPARIIRYREKLSFVLAHVNHVVNISNAQMQLFGHLKLQGKSEFKLHKILNGYVGKLNAPVSKTQLGIPEQNFVFGMVATGIKEKGWDEAIAAFQKVDRKDISLVLVGEGKRLDILKKMYQNDPRIIFTGFCAFPLDYIDCFDVGILPSYYDAESLPTAVIEYLFMKKPTIVTSVGEVKNMLDTGDQTNNLAGRIINFRQPDEIIPALVKEMSDMMSNTELLSLYRSRATQAFEKFRMDNCMKSYVDVYMDNNKQLTE